MTDTTKEINHDVILKSRKKLEMSGINDVSNFDELKQQLIEKAHESYNKYAFDEVYRNTLSYMTNQLSSYYLDYTKDPLSIY